MTSLKELQSQIAQLQRQAAEQRNCEMTVAVQEIRDLMQEYDVSVDDLQLLSKKGAFIKFSTVVFRNSETGATWCGRGRMPNWLAGQDKERFRV